MTLQPGKLPAELLAQLLARVPHDDPRLLLGPGLGRDAAAIDMGGGRVLVATTDPVTFAAHDIGWYAVHVNANDIACMGARPAWMLATALLPPGAQDDLPARIFDQLTRACAELGIELVGGHTEVTIGLERPVVVGAMLGEAARDEVVIGENITPGDIVLLTKGIAVEGTALLARESGGSLTRRGIDVATVERAQQLLFDPGISVVADARAICGGGKPRLMHDPTEGGIATALWELAQAAGATLRIDLDAVPVFDETRAVCAALGLDPLGLLASGALLAVVAPSDVERMLTELSHEKIPARLIGKVESGAPRVIIGDEDSATPLPLFARDEIARFYSQG